MRPRVTHAVSFAVLAAGAAVWALAAEQSSSYAALTPEHRALLERTRANQHRNDRALAEYERYERRIRRQENEKTRIVEDKTLRVVPTGTGTLNLVVEESGRPVAPEFYRKQLEALEKALAVALNPHEPGQRQRIEKFEKRRRERAEIVDALHEGFLFRYAGREMRNGRPTLRFELNPNPDFRPRSRTQSILAHTRAVVWVDEAAAQMVRGEAHILSDIAFGGGILGKVYAGGRFVLEQAPVTEEVWLPVRFVTEVRGRRFVFGFDVNEETEIRGHRRVGPPAEALAIIRRELRGAAANE